MSSNSSQNSQSTSTKTKLKDHVYRVGAANQASDYVTNTRFIIAYIKEKFTKGGAEIAWALENKEEYDFGSGEPEMQVIVSATADNMTYEEKMKQEQYKIKYQQDFFVRPSLVGNPLRGSVTT